MSDITKPEMKRAPGYGGCLSLRELKDNRSPQKEPIVLLKHIESGEVDKVEQLLKAGHVNLNPVLHHHEGSVLSMALWRAALNPGDKWEDARKVIKALVLAYQALDPLQQTDWAELALNIAMDQRNAVELGLYLWELGVLDASENKMRERVDGCLKDTSALRIRVLSPQPFVSGILNEPWDPKSQGEAAIYSEQSQSKTRAEYLMHAFIERFDFSGLECMVEGLRVLCETGLDINTAMRNEEPLAFLGLTLFDQGEIGEEWVCQWCEFLGDVAANPYVKSTHLIGPHWNVIEYAKELGVPEIGLHHLLRGFQTYERRVIDKEGVAQSVEAALSESALSLSHPRLRV